MRLNYEVVSDVGLRRGNNEDMALVGGALVRDDSDSFSFDIPEKGMKFAAIVCDGLGGYDSGEVASEMACRSFGEFVDGLPDGLDDNSLIQTVKQWCREVNIRIMQHAAGNSMGCTLTGLLIYFDRTLILNMGDSRTYRMRYGSLKQLTSDHSERLRTGDMTVSPSTIYNCIGVDGAFIDITPTRIVEGDSFIICSDGLCDMVGNETISANYASARSLVDSALAAGGMDNVTVITLHFE